MYLKTCFTSTWSALGHCIISSLSVIVTQFDYTLNIFLSAHWLISSIFWSICFRFEYDTTVFSSSILHLSSSVLHLGGGLMNIHRHDYDNHTRPCANTKSSNNTQTNAKKNSIYRSTILRVKRRFVYTTLYISVHLRISLLPLDGEAYCFYSLYWTVDDTSFQHI